jgi:hypothetical protein
MYIPVSQNYCPQQWKLAPSTERRGNSMGLQSLEHNPLLWVQVLRGVELRSEFMYVYVCMYVCMYVCTYVRSMHILSRLRVCVYVWLIVGVGIGWLGLLTPYTHHSELHAITWPSQFPRLKIHCYTLVSSVITRRIVATDSWQSHCHCNIVWSFLHSRIPFFQFLLNYSAKSGDSNLCWNCQLRNST